jgi:parallel beta-helix repeat protein
MNRRNLLSLIILSTINTLTATLFDSQVSFSQQPGSITFYVALNGNDRWSGRLAVPNSSKTDGPFATINRVQAAIRILKNHNFSKVKSITVLIRQGIHFLNKTLIFTEQDSGSSQCPITYKAYPDEKPIISGGKLISGWKKITVKNLHLWVMDLPSFGLVNWYFRQLWSMEKRLIRSRHPTNGYFIIEDFLQSSKNEKTHLRYKANNLKNWLTIDQSELVVMSLWKENRLPVAKINESTQEIWSDKIPHYSKIKKGDLYYLEGCLEIIDTPGEWFLDRNLGKLYYYPFPGESISTHQVIAPALSQIIKMDRVEYVNFQDLTFSHTDWYYESDYKYGSYVQSGQNREVNKSPNAGGYIGGIPGAIHAKNSLHCKWNNCEFSHLGGYALEIANACENIEISKCKFFDIGAGGVILGKNKKNKILNCEFNDLGIVFHSGVAIFIADSSKNYISNNHIHHLYYSGISVGWVWGYGSNPCKDNIIDSNYIHHIGITSLQKDRPILNDKGAIYLLGVQPGTIISNNKIHDILAFDFGGWGIYLDEGSSYIVVKNNLVYNTRDGGFQHHYGKENIVRNNIFAFGQTAQICRFKQENHLGFTFENNIVYWREGKLLEGKWNDTNNLKMDSNVYWLTTQSNITFNNLSLKDWQAKGLDKNSLMVDPQFLNIEANDFRLKAGSPAFQLGFKNI